MKQIYGNHLGIVISGGDQDPEGRGRCQVFIPHISNTLYEGWNKKLQDITITSLADIPSDILRRMEAILPWAECAAPINGGAVSSSHSKLTGRTALNPAASLQPATAPVPAPAPETPPETPPEDPIVDQSANPTLDSTLYSDNESVLIDGQRYYKDPETGKMSPFDNSYPTPPIKMIIPDQNPDVVGK